MRTRHTVSASLHAPLVGALVVAAVVACAAGARAQDPADAAARPAPPAPEAPAPPAPPGPAPAPPAPPAAPTRATQPAGDAALLAALLRLERALGEADAGARAAAAGDAIRELAALGDARAVPALERLSRQEQTALRFSALGALGAFLDDARAQRRLQETMAPGAPPDDAAVALPFLLELARRFPGERSVPCPDGWRCAADDVLLAALLAYADAETMPARVAAVGAVGALDDPRALPFTLRQSHADDAAVRAAGLAAVARLARHPAAKERLLAALAHPATADRAAAAAGLAALDGDDVTAALLQARTTETDTDVRATLEEILQARAPDALAALLVEEQRRLAELANAPGQFDTSMRAALTAVAAVGAGAGSAAASSLVADELQPGTGACYGAWGACAGGASAAAVGWFGLGDRKLDGAQVALAASASAWGAWTGLLVPPTIGEAATKDVRHMIYSAAAGQLLGLTLGTGSALFLKPSPVDVGEMNAIVLGVNALVAGVVLSVPPGGDERALWGALAASTAVGGAGAVYLSQHLALDEVELGHTALASGVGLVVGAAAAGALDAYDPHPTRIGGFALGGAALGATTGLVLGHFDRAPSAGGMTYEAWAAIAGGMVGAGGALFADALVNPTGIADGVAGDTQALTLGGLALGVGLGAASTAFVPEGIAQDGGDLLLQPLFVGFGLYHGGALALAAEADPRLVAAGALLTPALASAGLVYAAPHVSASTGDVLMIASMMGVGAYASSMALASIDARGAEIPPWGWVLATSLAMDAGIAGGVLLDLSNIDHVGWRTTYVVAVTAGTTLVLSLPGSLLASGTNGTVAVTDVLLGSSVLGAAIGFATMPLIDFRVAPDWGLGVRPTADARDAPPVQVAPSVVAFTPASPRDEAPMGLGVVGRF